LIIFIIEPEKVGLASLGMFGHPESHRILAILFKLYSFSGYDLLIIQPLFVSFFFILQLFVVVSNNLCLF